MVLPALVLVAVVITVAGCGNDRPTAPDQPRPAAGGEAPTPPDDGEGADAADAAPAVGVPDLPAAIVGPHVAVAVWVDFAAVPPQLLTNSIVGIIDDAIALADRLPEGQLDVERLGRVRRQIVEASAGDGDRDGDDDGHVRPALATLVALTRYPQSLREAGIEGVLVLLTPPTWAYGPPGISIVLRVKPATPTPAVARAIAAASDDLAAADIELAPVADCWLAGLSRTGRTLQLPEGGDAEGAALLTDLLRHGSTGELRAAIRLPESARHSVALVRAQLAGHPAAGAVALVDYLRGATLGVTAGKAVTLTMKLHFVDSAVAADAAAMMRAGRGLLRRRLARDASPTAATLLKPMLGGVQLDHADRVVTVTGRADLWLAAVVLPTVTDTTDKAAIARSAFALKRIHQASRAWAADHAGRLPDRLERLVEAGLLDASMLRNPRLPHRRADDAATMSSDYAFPAAGRRISELADDAIVAHARVSDELAEGICILYASGSAVFVPYPRALPKLNDESRDER